MINVMISRFLNRKVDSQADAYSKGKEVVYTQII